MIDTIVLMLQYPSQFSIAEHERFSPSTKALFQSGFSSGSRGYFSCFQNPTKEDLKNGLYKPRLTATRRVGQITLRIEFSIPKLIFGNNFDEVDDSSFAQVVDTLTKKLREMGVVIFREAIVNAPVSSVHYSKNIPLTDHSTPYGILKEISKINLTQALDLNQTDFRNEGHSLKFHANSYELVLYDKMKDLQKAKTSGKRALERDSAIQLDLFEHLKPKKSFEVLRIEARLNKREVIRRMLKGAGVICEPTFAELFKKNISQRVLLSFLEKIEAGYALIAYKPKTVKDFIADFRIKRPKAKMRKMLQILGLKTALNEMGIREFREATKNYGKHHWPRLMKDLATCKFRTSFSAIEPLIKALVKFEPLKLSDFCERNNWQSRGNAIKCNP